MAEPFWKQYLRPATLDPRYDARVDVQQRVHDAVLHRFGVSPDNLALASVFAVVAQCQAEFEAFAAQPHVGPAVNQVAHARNAFAAAFAATDVYIYTKESADPHVRVNPIVELGPIGYHRLWDSELANFGITGDVPLIDNHTGFYSALYCKGTPRAPGAKYILANRGSDDKGDFWNNVLQNFGLPASQYAQAVAAARAITKVVDQTGGSIIYAGHSLGGGLATLQALVFLRQAFTFQSAGINSWTLTQHGGITQQIDTYVTTFDYPGDWLDDLQRHGPALPPAGRRVLLPEIALLAGAPNNTAADRHLMNFVAPAMLQMLKAGHWP